MAKCKKWLYRHDRKRGAAKQPQLSFDLSNPRYQISESGRRIGEKLISDGNEKYNNNLVNGSLSQFLYMINFVL